MELIALGLVIAGILLWVVTILRRVPASIMALSSSLHELARAAQPELVALKDRVNQLQVDVESQKLKLEGYQSLWRQEAELAKSDYARARASLSAARRAQREAEELTAGDVPDVDDEGRAAEAVPPMRGRVAAEPATESPLQQARRFLLTRQLGGRR